MSIVSTWSLRCALTVAIFGELAAIHHAGAAVAQNPARGGGTWGLGLDVAQPEQRDAVLDDDGFEVHRVAAALFEPDPRIREEAVRRLPGRHFETEMPLVQLALADADARVRSAAVDALTDLGPGAAAVAAAVALGDVDAAVRERAVYVLGDLGGAIAIRGLFDVLADADESVREAAATLLAELEPPAPAGSQRDGDRRPRASPGVKRPDGPGSREGFR